MGSKEKKLYSEVIDVFEEINVEKKVYCEHCNDLVEFNTIKNQEMYDDFYKVNYNGTKCICKICNKEVESDLVDFYNNNIAKKQFKSNKIT